MRQLWFVALAVFLAVIANETVSSQANAALPADVEKRIDAILAKMTLEEKIDYLGGVDRFYVRAIPQAGVPRLKMADGPIGIRNYGPSTTLAGGIALASTWDAALARQAGQVLGEDARARGVHFLLGPGVNISRAPMNGRNFEYFGEDPFLASRIAVNYIQGVQSKNVCATVKHFAGNNSEFDRHNVDSIIDDRTLREIYLPVFEAAVKEAHVCSIMDSYNLTNGEHMSQNGRLNNDVAKKEWGFDGIIMSDWTSTYDGVAAVNGGLDLEMPKADFVNKATLLPAIKSGKVGEATIDDHVRRILRRAIEYGWLDHEQTDLLVSRYNLEGKSTSLRAAREGMVLLKNEHDLLPFDKSKTKTLAVIGPVAYPGVPVGGGSAAVRPFNTVSVLEGISNYLGEDVNVVYHPGIDTLYDLAESTNFTTEANSSKAGVKLERFKSADLSGPSDTTMEQHMNFGFTWPNFHTLAGEYRSARWTGYYAVKLAGSYGLYVQGADENSGYRVFVDDKVVLDGWERAIASTNYVRMELSSGPHKVQLDFFRRRRNGDVRLGIVDLASVVDDDAKTMAARADAVVVAVGFDPSTESEGSDRTFALPPGQDELVQAMLAANENVVVVVTSGGAVDMGRWIDRTPALFEAWYPGQEGGTALAQLLFGEYSPSGKLPVSFDRRWEDSAVFHSYYPNASEKQVKYTEGVFLGYRHYDKAESKPLFPFGHGLSYTTFKYSNLTVAPASVGGGSPVTVSFQVTNTGKRAGAEVAEVYVSDTHAKVPRPVKELKGFARVELKPGETRPVTVKLDRRSFSYYDAGAKQWQADPGEFGVLVGSSSQKIELQGKVSLTK